MVGGSPVLERILPLIMIHSYYEWKGIHILPDIPLSSSVSKLKMEKPRVTEILVRMDCYGCVQKIKKALNAINGIDDLYIDIPQQKITVIGMANPENIVKAIVKKTKRIATISAHIEPTEPPSEAREPPPPEVILPSLAMANDIGSGQPMHPSGEKNVEEVSVICDHPPDHDYRYGYDGHWNNYNECFLSLEDTQYYSRTEHYSEVFHNSNNGKDL